MSYAGPASRGKRAPDTRFVGTRPSRVPGPGAPGPSMLSRPTHRNHTVVFGAGIAIGLAIGAGIALLFAPHSGEETRAAIARRGRRLTRRSRDAWDDLRHELRSVVERRSRARRARREEALCS